MSFTKVEQDEDSLENSLEDDQEIKKKVLKNLKDFKNILGKLESHRGDENLMQLLQCPYIEQKIKILKELQLETVNIEAKFFAELQALKCKYYKLYEPIYKKRKLIVIGAYEPTHPEAQWPSDEEAEYLEEQLMNKDKIEEEQTPESISRILETKTKSDPVGIPSFWLTIFQNVNFLCEMVGPQDKPVLTHLQDIKVDCSENPMNFTLSFHFTPNQYFTNSVLTKKYFMKCEPNKDDLSNFDGPEIYKCEGCTINWNKGMNMTLKTVVKKQKHKSRDVVRTVTRTFKTKSFFNFFTPPKDPENGEEEAIDNELHQLLTSDFEIGRYIKEKIIPKAVLFYLGEPIEDEDDYYETIEFDYTTDESQSDNEANNEIARDGYCKQQ